MNIPFIIADSVSVAVFVLIAISIIWALLFGAGQISRSFLIRCGFFAFIWMFVFSNIVSSGFLEGHLWPGLPIFLAFINLSAIGLGLSPAGKNFASLPLWTLVVFQCFRLPLELVLHHWASLGTVPPQMTWTGQNFDIISGVLAAAVFIKPLRTKKFALIFNIVGMLLLLNILRVVVLSSPLPFGWRLSQPLVLAFHMPYAMIAFICVWSAIFGHVVLTRALLRKPS